MTVIARLAEGIVTPPKPVDRQGRPVSWVATCAEPGFYYQGAFYPVDEAWIDDKIAQYQDYTRGGSYTSPVLSEHDPRVTEGKRLGDVLALGKARLPAESYTDSSGQTVTIPERWALASAVGWALSDAPEDIESGAIKYFSPGLGTVEDETGRRWEGVLREISVVAAPHQKELTAHTHILATEADTMACDPNKKMEEGANPAPESEDPMTKMVQMMDALSSRMDAMEKRMEEGAPTPAPEDAEEDDPQEMSEADKRIAALEARLAEMTAKADRAAFDAAYKDRVGRTVTLSEGMADAIYTLSNAAPEALASLLGAAQAPTPTPTKSPAPSATDWTARLGEGSAPVEAPGKVDKMVLLTEARAEAKGDAVKAQGIYLNKLRAHGLG